MRIRKDAKLSSEFFSHALGVEEPLQAHICPLNQSPWDVPSAFQFGEYDSFTTNGSFGNSSTAAVESNVASLMEANNKVMHEKKEEEEQEEEKEKKQLGLKRKDQAALVLCNKTDGKKWQCKRIAKEGHNMCEHHLSQLKSYNETISAKKKGRGGRWRGKKGNSSSENPYQFYYYTGFGPKWGKKRGGRDNMISSDANNSCNDSEDLNVVVETSQKGSPSSSLQIDGEEIDYVDDDDDDEMEMRKPVKARSLKSLM